MKKKRPEWLKIPLNLPERISYNKEYSADWNKIISHKTQSFYVNANYLMIASFAPATDGVEIKNVDELKSPDAFYNEDHTDIDLH